MGSELRRPEEEEGQNNKCSVAWDDRVYPDAL